MTFPSITVDTSCRGCTERCEETISIRQESDSFLIRVSSPCNSYEVLSMNQEELCEHIEEEVLVRSNDSLTEWAESIRQQLFDNEN